MNVSFVTNRLLPLALLLLFICSCIQGPGLFQQEKSGGGVAVESKVDANGIITGEFKAGSSVTQQLTAGGAISGSSAKFPPGALAIDTEITMQEGASIAATSLSSKLGINAGKISSAGAAVVITSSKSIDTSKPFTLEIPVDGAGLRLGDGFENLVILYKVEYAKEGTFYIGVIPRDKITVSGGVASFDTNYFGSYQAAITEVKVTEAAKTVADSPILTKIEEEELKPVKFSVSTPSVDSTARTITFSASATGFKKVIYCSVFVYEDGETYVDYGDSDTASNISYTYKVKDNAAHSYAAVFACEDNAGRYEESKLSDEAAIAAVVPPGDPSEEESGFTNLASQTMSAVRIKISWEAQLYYPDIEHFKIVWSTSPTQEYCVGGGGNELLVENESVDIFVEQTEDLTDLDPGTNYYIRVCSETSSGVFSVGQEITETTSSLDNAICNGGGTLADTCIISGAGTTVPDWTVISGPGNLTISNSTHLTVTSPGSLLIDMNGTVTINGTINGNVDIYADTIIVATTATINADGYGYAGGAGGASGGQDGQDGEDPDYYGSQGLGGAGGGSGGGYAGFGGVGSPSNSVDPDISGGTYFGAISFQFENGLGGGGGKGGAAQQGGAGGNGGGSIELEANEIQLHGQIRAYGSSGGTGNSSDAGGGGGGAGGSIFITSNTLLAITTPNLRVEGGGGGLSNGDGDGGGGSGGRIAIHCFETCPSNADVDTDIGLHLTGGYGASSGGATGTFYFASYTTPFVITKTATGSTNASLTVVDFDSEYWTDLGDIQFNGNSQVQFVGDQEYNEVSINSIDIDANSKITQTAGGYEPGEGPGAGQHGLNQGEGGGGGAHDGNGGDGGNHSSSGGSSYSDDPNGPTFFGSGGGDSTGAIGGAGGGALKLIVSSNITLDGTIEANGTNGETAAAGVGGGGGGGGGSIWLEASDVTGNGSITANGGDGGGSGGGGSGGGGGGGLIFINPPTSFSNCFANYGTPLGTGGASGTPGAPGTTTGC
jgi:hypothetical protein